MAPPELAESWDNVGLLVGDRQAFVTRVMTCLTVTGDTVAEAVDQKAGLLVTHHPLPFRPLNRLTADTPEGRYLLQLIGSGVAVYSAHTAFDSAREGINQRLAEGIGLQRVVPLVAQPDCDPALGAGRVGEIEDSIDTNALAARVRDFLGIDGVRAVGEPTRSLHRVAVACGSAGELLEAARLAECDAMVTGETSFHTCLAAEAHGVTMLLTGHFASERFAMESMAELLGDEFDDVHVWASQTEKDPLRWL
jgi:dinuclear metal center YbgI/SA1388 family protein